MAAKVISFAEAKKKREKAKETETVKRIIEYAKKLNW